MSVFAIFIDRLRGGQTYKIELKVEPAFLGPDEPELKFDTPVQIKGEAYLTDDHLILHCKAHTAVRMPCAVCNEMIEVKLEAKEVYHTEPIGEIKSAVFDFSEVLREALLIELPRTAECNLGKCKERGLMTPYMKAQERTHCPFANMEKDLKLGE